MSFLINPFVFSSSGGGGGGVSYFFDEVLGPTNIPVGGSYTPTASLTVLGSEQIPNAIYAGFWMVDHENPDTANATNRLNKNSGATIEQSSIIRLKDSNPLDRHNMGGLFFLNAGPSPSDVTYTVEHNKVSNGACTAYNSRIILLELGPDDQNSEDLAGPGAISSTTMTTIASLSLPGSNNDWAVFASCNVSGGNSTLRYELTDGTTTTGDLKPGIKGSFSESNIPITTGLYLPNITSGTVEFKVRTTSASFPVTPSVIRIVAIRLDRFSSVVVSSLSTNNSGIDTAYVTGHSQTFTPDASDYLTLAVGAITANSTTSSNFGRFLDGGVEISQYTREMVASGDAYPFFSGTVSTYSASSRTQEIQRRSESGTVTTTLVAQAFIISIKLS